MRSKLIVMTALALALGGCNRPDVDHPKTDYTTSLLSRMSAAEIDKVTVPPAPADRGPIPPDANAADPATNASLAFPNGSGGNSSAPAPDNSPDGEHAAVMAQEAAARAPDTAAADEAKRRIYEEYAARGSVAANANASSMNGSSQAPVAARSNGSSGNETTAAPNAASSTDSMAEAPDGASSQESSIAADASPPLPSTLEKS